MAGGRGGLRRLPAASALLIWFALWELAGRAEVSLIVPPFSRVVTAGWAMLGTPKLAAAAAISVQAFGLGLGLALAVGIPAGVLMARVEAARHLLGLWVNAFVSAPVSALVPLLMAVLGIGQATVVATVFLFSVFVLVLDTEVGVRQASRSLEEMARSFGARRAQVYRAVLLWSALPEILAGVRIAVIRAAKGVVIGQLVVSVVGLGELLELYSRNFLMEEFWALVLMVFLVAFAASEAVAVLERRVEYYAARR